LYSLFSIRIQDVFGFPNRTLRICLSIKKINVSFDTPRYSALTLLWGGGRKSCTISIIKCCRLYLLLGLRGWGGGIGEKLL